MANIRVDPEAERWREAVSATAARLRAAAPAGVLVEPKGLSVTCHYRANPALGSQVTALAGEVAAATGLVVRAASRWNFSGLSARIGHGHSQVGRPCRAACYLGDDTGDLAAFRALDQLAARGIGTARIAVRSDEAPAELLHAVDVTVDAPEGAAALLRTLL